jgi:hypothetical protein
MMGWGRYSGFFFYEYRNGMKYLYGPYDSRDSANQAKWMKNNSGKVFQKEKPVWSDK